MDFGKLAHVNGVDFRLPSDSPRNRRAIGDAISRGRSSSALDTARHAYVGAPVWGVKEWVGSVYPSGTQASSVQGLLWHYSRQFNAIELNTTHYQIPRAEKIASWVGDTPETFRFCPKFPQAISHAAEFGRSVANDERTREFVHAMRGLKPRLGLCFLQLPPDFTIAGQAALDRFLGRLPSGFPIAVEFRHPSWFAQGQLLDGVLDLLQARGASVVITDVAGRRDVLHSSLTSDQVLIRFVGNAGHPSDELRLADWQERLQHWVSLGLRRFYFFVHQPDNALSPSTINAWLPKLRRELGSPWADDLREWKSYMGAPAETEPAPQLDLFGT